MGDGNYQAPQNTNLIFPAGTVIPARGYLTFANENFSFKYNSAPTVIKNSVGTLDL